MEFNSAAVPHPRFFHHVELQSGDARLLASQLSRALGMRVIGALRTERGTSYCLQSQQAIIVCTSALERPCALLDTKPSADFHAGIARSKDVGVRAIGLCVPSIADVSDRLSAVLCADRDETMTPRTHRMVDVSLPHTLGGMGLRFTEAELAHADGIPSGIARGVGGFDLLDANATTRPGAPGGVIGIDHVAINVKEVPEVCARLQAITGWTFFRAFKEEVLHRPLTATTIQSETAEGLLTIVQPTADDSIFAHALAAAGGASVHHIALRCEDILQLADYLFARGMWETMPPPAPDYYREVEPLASEFMSDEAFSKLRRYGMLLDFQDDCALVQVFLPYLGDVPGVFFELIGRLPRRGAHSNRRPAPGCGGFGDRNVTELYDCLLRAVNQWPGEAREDIAA